MRILAKGHSRGACVMDVDKKRGRGWVQISDIVLDKSYIGGRYVCIMEKPDDPNRNKNNFNNYMGY